jgi:hypothetical protein
MTLWCIRSGNYNTVSPDAHPTWRVKIVRWMGWCAGKRPLDLAVSMFGNGFEKALDWLQ